MKKIFENQKNEILKNKKKFQNLLKNDNRIKVFVRVRPPFDSEIEIEDFFNIVELYENDDNRISLLTPRKEFRKVFFFDRVFGIESSQEEIYSPISKELIKDVLNGKNGTIITYGQTSTGKSYTLGILGNFELCLKESFKKEIDENVGILPRCLSEIFRNINPIKFNEKKKLIETRMTFIYISCIQIYLEKVQDLLNPEIENLELREIKETNEIIISGLKNIEVNNEEEALKVIDEALKNRKMAPTLINFTSSRAHTIITIRIKRIEKDSILESSLTLVDLAGSERVNKTRSVGSRLNEAKKINKSLSVLGTVISSLSNKLTKYIPYRDSKLTRILKNVLNSKNSKLILISTISPSNSSYFESHSTLTFASRCMKIEMNAMINIKPILNPKKKNLPTNKIIKYERSSPIPKKLKKIDYKEKCNYLQKENNFLKKKLSELMLRNSEKENFFAEIEKDFLSKQEEKKEIERSSINTKSTEKLFLSNDENRKKSEEITESVNYSKDLEISWDLVYALYDSLYDIYEISFFVSKELFKRTKIVSNNWNFETISGILSNSSNKEEKLENERLLKIMRNVSEKYPISKNLKEIINFEKKFEKQSQLDGENIYDFVCEIEKLHKFIISEFIFLNNEIEYKDLQFDDTKREICSLTLGNFEKEKELESWMNLLKKIFNENVEQNFENLKKFYKIIDEKEIKKLKNNQIFIKKETDLMKNYKKEERIEKKQNLKSQIEKNMKGIEKNKKGIENQKRKQENNLDKNTSKNEKIGNSSIPNEKKKEKKEINEILSRIYKMYKNTEKN